MVRSCSNGTFLFPWYRYVPFTEERHSLWYCVEYYKYAVMQRWVTYICILIGIGKTLNPYLSASYPVLLSLLGIA